MWSSNTIKEWIRDMVKKLGQSDWLVNNPADPAYIKNKPTIPTKTSELTNDSDYVSDASYEHANNGKLTIQRNGTTVKTFTANQSTNVTANITVPTKTSDLTNDSDFVSSSSLATVATSGSYNDLTNKPTIPAAQVNSDWKASSGVAKILNKPTLATVATSGSYNDLTNKPTIPAAQVNSDWNASSGVAKILNKPTIPTVNNGTLTIQKNGTNVQTFTANQSSNATANITVPTKVSELSQDAGGNIFYGTCSTAAATAAKEVTVSADQNFALKVGAIICVKFTNSNSASNVTINVNSTGAKSIYYSNAVYTGSSTTVCGYANTHFYYMYDGTNWAWISHGSDSNTTYSSMSVEEGSSGTATTARVLTAANLKSIIEAIAGGGGGDAKGRVYYGTCSTAAATAAKEVTVSADQNFVLEEGSTVMVMFTNTNSASNVTINVNSTGAKSIYYNTAVYTSSSNLVCGKANICTTYVYDGTNWVWLNCGYETQYSSMSVSEGQTGTATSGRVLTAANLKSIIEYHAVPSGRGVPSGGSAGQYLKKNSATDYDTTWGTVNEVPSSGTTGHVLTKTSSGYGWSAAPAATNGLPTGGSQSQFLTKNSATNYDAKWVSINQVPSSGTTGHVLTKTSSGYGWSAAPAATNGLPTGGAANNILVKNSATNYDCSWTLGPYPIYKPCSNTGYLSHYYVEMFKSGTTSAANLIGGMAVGGGYVKFLLQQLPMYSSYSSGSVGKSMLYQFLGGHVCGVFKANKAANNLSTFAFAIYAYTGSAKTNINFLTEYGPSTISKTIYTTGVVDNGQSQIFPAYFEISTYTTCYSNTGIKIAVKLTNGQYMNVTANSYIKFFMSPAPQYS